MKRLSLQVLICSIVAAITACELSAASRLAGYFESYAKYSADPTRRTEQPDAPDVMTLVPAEEIPAIVNAVRSGNPPVMFGALEMARAILQVHVNDNRYPPAQRQLSPALPEVQREFQALAPVLNDHFADVLHQENASIDGYSDMREVAWKTQVVGFFGVLGAKPTAEMVEWMVSVVGWPHGRAEMALAALDRLRPTHPPAATDPGLVKTTNDIARATALRVIPVLAQLDPMPPAVLNALVQKMNDSSEPAAAALAIQTISTNAGVDASKLADVLIDKANDRSSPSAVRAAALHGIGGLVRLRSALPEVPQARLPGLAHDPDESVAAAAVDIGLH